MYLTRHNPINNPHSSLETYSKMKAVRVIEMKMASRDWNNAFDFD